MLKPRIPLPEDLEKELITYGADENTSFGRKYSKTLKKSTKKKQAQLLDSVEEAFDIKKKESIPTTKLFVLFIIINCVVVEFYSMWVMYTLRDLSALYALIAAVITESISFAVYCCKSYFETKEQEKIKFEYSKLDAATAPIEEMTEEPEESEEDESYIEVPQQLVEEEE